MENNRIKVKFLSDNIFPISIEEQDKEYELGDDEYHPFFGELEDYFEENYFYLTVVPQVGWDLDLNDFLKDIKFKNEIPQYGLLSINNMRSIQIEKIQIKKDCLLLFLEHIY